MRAGGMKSSKCRKESRRNSSGGIHPFLLISTLRACSSEGVGRGMQNLKGMFFLCAFHWKNKFARGNPAL